MNPPAPRRSALRLAPRCLASAASLVAASVGAVASAAAAEPEGYLVAPLENASGVKALDWMASALAVTVAEKLEALPELRPAYGSSPLDGWPAHFDAQRAAEHGRESGARLIFTGSFWRPNWKAGVRLRLLSVGPTGVAEVAMAEAVGEREELLGVLDRALDQLLAARGITPDAERAGWLHRPPTRDLYALTLFGRGLNAFYGFDGPRDPELAEKTLARTTHIDPRFAEAHRLLGVLYLSRGQEGRAAAQFAQALELKPGYYPALAGLAQLYRADNKRQQARELADKALLLRPWDVEMRLLLGTLEWEAGDLDKALADLTRVAEAQPRNLGAHRALAQVHASRDDAAALAGELERIVELAPDDLEARLDLGSAWMRLGRLDRAVATYEEVQRRQPRSLQAAKFAGDLYRRLGEPHKAVLAYERLRHLAPDDPRAYFLLGAAYVEAGRDDKAIAVLEEALQFRNYQGEAWTDLGALALRRGDMKRAESLLTRAVARVPMRPKAHFNYALFLDATQKRDRALSEARTAVELDPEEADYHYLAGVICLRLGRLDEAKAAFAEAVRLKPGHADARHNLALLQDLDRRYGAEHAGRGDQ